MLNEKLIQFISILTVWILMGIALILSGFMIENVNESVYPWATSLLLIYMMIGYFVLKRKGIKPELSREIQAGEVDQLWALKFWYWACWWPAFLRKNK